MKAKFNFTLSSDITGFIPVYGIGFDLVARCNIFVLHLHRITTSTKCSPVFGALQENGTSYNTAFRGTVSYQLLMVPRASPFLEKKLPMLTSCQAGEKLFLGNFKGKSSTDVVAGVLTFCMSCFLQQKPEQILWCFLTVILLRDLESCASKCFPLVPVWSESLLL